MKQKRIIDKKVLLIAAGAAFVYLLLCVNLLLLQMDNLRQADTYLQNNESYKALFHLGQCLREKVPFSPYTKLCAAGAKMLLPKHPEMKSYIDGHVAATARFGEDRPLYSVLLHLGFLMFFALLFAQIRWDLRRSRKWRLWWWGGTTVSLALWLGMALLV